MKMITRMRDFFRKKTWIITALMFVLAFSLSLVIAYFEFGLRQNVKTTSASSSNNVTGYAWSPNIGWLSFNCTGDSPACGASNYGVSIDLTSGYFSGYAWSQSVGWVSFNRRTCLGGSDNGASCKANSDCSSNNCRLDGPGAAGAPLQAPYNTPASLDYNAIYDYNTGLITGWAKILSLGDNGWIKLRKFASDSGSDYGLSIDPATGNFSGWAWNANSDSSGIGWLSFNCANETPACSGTDYKVVGDVNRPPTADSLTAPNWNYVDAGGIFGARNAKLNWIFSDPDVGASESAYQIIFDDDNDPAAPLFDTGKCLGYNNPIAACKINAGAGQYPINETVLNYDAPYYWWVKVWDNHGAESALTPYNTSPDTDNNDGTLNTFTTYKHEMPDVSFSWFPVEPSKGEEVKFIDASRVYLSGAPATAVSCNNSICDWAWSASGGAVFKDNDTATSSPTITFNSAGSATVTLTVTDDDGYYISRSETINVNAKLPKWKEVKPE